MIRIACVAVLYALLSASAIWADGAGSASDLVGNLRSGDMRKLVVHAAPKPASDVEIAWADGQAVTLEDYRGRVVIANFWAAILGGFIAFFGMVISGLFVVLAFRIDNAAKSETIKAVHELLGAYLETNSKAVVRNFRRMVKGSKARIKNFGSSGFPMEIH